MKRDLYAEVSARIIAELEAGAAPWVGPWSATAGANTPCNAVTNRPYSGCNVVLFWIAAKADYRTPRYLTFKQALELGGNVRKWVTLRAGLIAAAANENNCAAASVLLPSRCRMEAQSEFTEETRVCSVA
jgi:hypothetical protein